MANPEHRRATTESEFKRLRRDRPRPLDEEKTRQAFYEFGVVTKQLIDDILAADYSPWKPELSSVVGDTQDPFEATRRILAAGADPELAETFEPEAARRMSPQGLEQVQRGVAAARTISRNAPALRRRLDEVDPSLAERVPEESLQAITSGDPSEVARLAARHSPDSFADAVAEGRVSGDEMAASLTQPVHEESAAEREAMLKQTASMSDKELREKLEEFNDDE